MVRSATLSAVLIATACSHGADALPDGAPPADAGPSGGVRVTVTGGGRPATGLTVYFLDADQTVVATQTTDAAGQASAALHAGGSVTVAHPVPAPSADAYQLESWVGVQPGDELTLDLPVERVGLNLQVTVPTAPQSGVASYRVMSPCGATDFFLAGAAANLSLAPNCMGPGQTSDFTVFAQGAGEQDVAVFVAPQVTVTPHLALTGDYQPLLDVPISVTHLGAAPAVTFAAASMSDRGLSTHANGALQSSNGTAAGTFHWPPQLTTGARVIQAGVGPDAGGSLTSWAPVAATVDIDLLDVLGQPMTSQATIDAAHQSIAWTLAPQGAPAHLAIASLEADQGGGRYVAWTIVAPGSTPSIAVPQLPSSVFRFPDQPPGVGMTLLRVPGGTAAWTTILGAGGYYANFVGLMAATPSGVLTQVGPPPIPL